jgi:hypothetical protein
MQWVDESVASAVAPRYEDGQVVLEICRQNNADRLLRKMRRRIEQRNSPLLHLIVTWVTHIQTSFIIMSNKGRLPASGLGAKRLE